MTGARPLAKLAGALLLALASPGATALAQEASYRVDWNLAQFTEPHWLFQCTYTCPNDNLVLSPNPETYQQGSIRVIGGPYVTGLDLERDRARLLQAGLPTRPLRVEVFDAGGRRIDGVLLGDPAELRRLAVARSDLQPQAQLQPPFRPQARSQASPPAKSPSQALTPPPRAAAVSTLCRFSVGSQAGRTVDFAGRPGVTGIAIGSRCADADGSMGVVVAPDAPQR